MKKSFVFILFAICNFCFYAQNIKVIAQALRKIKEVTLDEVAEKTTNNVHKIYNLYK